MRHASVCYHSKAIRLQINHVMEAGVCIISPRGSVLLGLARVVRDHTLIVAHFDELCDYSCFYITAS